MRLDSYWLWFVLDMFGLFKLLFSIVIMYINNIENKVLITKGIELICVHTPSLSCPLPSPLESLILRLFRRKRQIT